MPLHQRCPTDISLADVVVQLRRQVGILTQYLADLQPVVSDTDSYVDDPDHRFVLSSSYTYDADHENDEFHDEKTTFIDELSPCGMVDISPVFDEYPVELDGDDEYYSFLPRYDDESVSYEDHIKLDGDDDASYSSPPVYDEESMFFEGSFELDDKDATIDSCLQVFHDNTVIPTPKYSILLVFDEKVIDNKLDKPIVGASSVTCLLNDAASFPYFIFTGVAMLKLCEMSRLSLPSYTLFGLLQEPSVVKALLSSIPPEPPPIALDSRSNLSNPGRDDVKQVEFKGVRILRVLNLKRLE